MISLIRGWFAFSIAPLCFGGGGGSTSSSSSNTTTNSTTNTDKRMVTSDNAIALSGDNSSIHITQSDGGAMKAATDLFKMSADANATNYDNLLNTSSAGLKGVLDFASSAMGKSFEITKTTQDNAKTMMDIGQSKGTLDNRTITILGVAVVAAIGVFAFRR